MQNPRNPLASTGTGAPRVGACTPAHAPVSGLASVQEEKMDTVNPVIRHATLEHGGTAYVSVDGPRVCLNLSDTHSTTFHHFTVADARSIAGLLSIPECYAPDPQTYSQERRALAPTTTDGESHEVTP
jgi:hypothetical protein